MAHGAFSEAVQAAAELIEEVIAGIEQNHGDPDGLPSLRVHLVELLSLIERSPGIDAAADDLDAAATGLVQTTAAEGASSLVRRQRLLREAFKRFQQRLAQAKPSAKAQRMGFG